MSDPRPLWKARARSCIRAFGFSDTGEIDPFLLLDDFRNDRPEDYRTALPGYLGPGRRKTLPVESNRHAFAYVPEGAGAFIKHG